MREARATEAAREEAQRVEEEKRAAKKLTCDTQEAERIQLAPTRQYTGSCKSFRKSDLLDVLASLALVADPSDAADLRNQKGTNAELVERIESYLAGHPNFATHTQFMGLYPGGRKRRLEFPDQENTPAPASSSDLPPSNRRRVAFSPHIVPATPLSLPSDADHFPPASFSTYAFTTAPVHPQPIYSQPPPSESGEYNDPYSLHPPIPMPDYTSYLANDGPSQFPLYLGTAIYPPNLP